MLFFLWPAVILLLPHSDASKCEYILKDAFRCIGPSIQNLSTLGVPANMTQVLIMETNATQLKADVVSGIRTLQRLILSSNQLSTISPGAFKGLIKLKTLKLLQNKLTRLPVGVFDETENLQQLILEDNSLENLEPGLFDNLVNLQELFLNRNYLTQLPGELFKKLVKLILLNVSRNYLAALPSNIFSTLPKLERLFLYANSLRSIESGMFDNLRELLELRLHSNHIHSIAPEAFHKLLKLQVLTLSKNKLQSLPSGLFLYLHNLTMLTLYQNPLKSLPELLFGEMRNLQSLWLYHTELSTLPEFVLSNLTNLELLVVTRNPALSVLPQNVFRGLCELLSLSLHTNNLSSLPEGIFQGLQKLQVVSLSENGINILPGNLFQNLSCLKAIYLNHTKLHSLPRDFFSPLPRLQEVSLSGNPWECTCAIAGFVEWLRNSSAVVKDAPSLTCSSPSALRNMPLLSVADDEVACLPATTPTRPAFESSTRSRTVSLLFTALLASTLKPTRAELPALIARSSNPSNPAPSVSFLPEEIPGQSGFYPSGTPERRSTSPVGGSSSVAEAPVPTSVAAFDRSPGSRTTGLVLNIKAPFSQIFFHLYVLASVAQALVVVTTLYVVCKIRHVLPCDRIPVQAVVLLSVSRSSAK
uniref:Glycoprotein V platelet n=1 Tax=Sphenodon punctatus TaxID=8508 RepID=A0A8D0HFX9_SPHPU